MSYLITMFTTFLDIQNSFICVYMYVNVLDKFCGFKAGHMVDKYLYDNMLSSKN